MGLLPSKMMEVIKAVKYGGLISSCYCGSSQEKASYKARESECKFDENIFCFLGSGNEEEDQYMHMVVANLLQKHQAYVSMARGGFNSLLEYLTDVGIDLTEWIVGTERSSANAANTSGKQSYLRD